MKRKRRIINVHDNHLREDQLWERVRSSSRRRSLADTNWGTMMEVRIILSGDFNPHSLEWNLHCSERRDTEGLKAVIERHRRILNNEPETATRPTQSKTTSTIDLTFTTSEIGAMDPWIIDEELSTPSEYEVIVFDTASLDETIEGMRTSQEVTGWKVKGMGDDARKEAPAH